MKNSEPSLRKESASGIPQSVKTQTHMGVCDFLVLQYKSQVENGDPFGKMCESADNAIEKAIWEQLSETLNFFESLVLGPDGLDDDSEEQYIVLRAILNRMAVCAIASMVELGEGTSKVANFSGICTSLNTLYDAKNQDYGNAFAKSLEKYGLTMTCIRLSDKLNRFRALAVDRQQQKVNDESILDTLMDFANYTILTLVELKLKRDLRR